ncbi:MAG: CocE/NonD family hydrolase [Gemmatimonadales bacterium]
MTRHIRTLVIGGLLAAPLSLEGQGPRPGGPIPPPPPKYQVRVDRAVMVPMRDGVRLSTDLYFPIGIDGKLPVVLMRTPYNKKLLYNRQWGDAAYVFAGQGYAVAVQDVRGRYESEGTYFFSGQEPQDGYDATDWVSKQPWSTGKVGTYGCSYLGEVQYQQARLRHPNLTAMIPQGAGPTKYRYFGVTSGGVLELAVTSGWFYTQGTKVFYRPPPGLSREHFLETLDLFNPAPTLPTIDLNALWKTLPVVDILKKAKAPPTEYEAVASHGPGDPWWDSLGYVRDDDRFDVPALHINSWYDMGVAETLELFNLLATNAETARGRDNQYAVISPTTHCVSERMTERTVVGERDLGDARFDYWNLYLQWFDHWLKGADNGVTARPKLQLYAMGRNQWRGEAAWPLARAVPTDYYLHSGGRANSRWGDGVLSLQLPKNEPPDSFVYDPAQPVPTSGGALCAACAAGQTREGGIDQSDIETRHDVLVYTTAPLERGVEVTGPIEATLYLSSSARDTDLTAKLVDVHPDGRAFNVQEGILRVRYRNSFERPELMTPGAVYEVKIDLHATSNHFGPGHRIRLEVSSSNFPRFERNLNTGGRNYDETAWVVAKNQIHHSPRYRSRVRLPIVPSVVP